MSKQVVQQDSETLRLGAYEEDFQAEIKNNQNPKKTMTGILTVLLVITLTIVSLGLIAIFEDFFATQGDNWKIFAGEIHFSRIPVEYWEHRIQMVKAMGLNTLSVYVMWNYHEIQKGVFDFETGNRNLDGFLQLAEKYGMMVLIRPGPYVCAEWDFGGLPARLLSIKGLEIRAYNKIYLEEVQIYFRAVSSTIQKHLWTKSDQKKCIIMLQIENQYGSYGKNLTYIVALKEMWERLGVHTLFYHEDSVSRMNYSHWYGGNMGISNLQSLEKYQQVKNSFEKVQIIFGGEIYPGWLTHWHEKSFVKVSSGLFVGLLKKLMQNKISYSIYMAHGGTNFGLTAGANQFKKGSLVGFYAHVTSYDYDAPISEQGAATLKYLMLRSEIASFAEWEIPEIPKPIKMSRIAPIYPSPIASLYENIEALYFKITSDTVYPFESPELEMFNQGIVVYRAHLPMYSTLTFSVKVHDIGYVRINHKFFTLLERQKTDLHNLTIDCSLNLDSQTSQCTIEILVEAMGHINYQQKMRQDYKGLLQFKCLADKGRDCEELGLQWEMYTINIEKDQETILTKWKQLTSNSQQLRNSPVLQFASFQIDDDAPGDTYLNMSKFVKGYVWVNGHNLGRYYSVGPQYKLFCPGVWLNGKGRTNSLYVLEMMYDTNHSIVGDLHLEQTI